MPGYREYFAREYTGRRYLFRYASIKLAALILVSPRKTTIFVWRGASERFPSLKGDIQASPLFLQTPALTLIYHQPENIRLQRFYTSSLATTTHRIPTWLSSANARPQPSPPSPTPAATPNAKLPAALHRSPKRAPPTQTTTPQWVVPVTSYTRSTIGQ